MRKYNFNKKTTMYRLIKKYYRWTVAKVLFVIVLVLWPFTVGLGVSLFFPEPFSVHMDAILDYPITWIYGAITLLIVFFAGFIAFNILAFVWSIISDIISFFRALYRRQFLPMSMEELESNQIASVSEFLDCLIYHGTYHMLGKKRCIPFSRSDRKYIQELFWGVVEKELGKSISIKKLYLVIHGSAKQIADVMPKSESDAYRQIISDADCLINRWANDTEDYFSRRKFVDDLLFKKFWRECR